MTSKTWFKQRTPITETLSLKEVAKFLKILEIKFVSGTKLSRKESFVLMGLRLLPEFLSLSNPSYELFFTSELQKCTDVYFQIKRSGFLNASEKNRNYPAICKHLRNFCVLGCGYFNY